MRAIFLCLTLLLLTGCTPPSPLPAVPPQPSPTPVAGLHGAIEQGLSFLRGQYDPALSLLEESPVIGANRYFLANDALLAVQVFRLYGETELAAAVERALTRYGVTGNNFIEVAWGRPIPWPPRHFEDPGTLVAAVGDKQVYTIRHEGPGYFSDWSGFSNLAFMAVHNELNLGNRAAASRLYAIEVSTFDGYGFPDLAYQRRQGVYETLGLAWGVYAAGRLGIDAHLPAPLLARLLAQQDPSTGGFHTHYRAEADRLADPNVETTAVALLALAALQGSSALPLSTLGLPLDEHQRPIEQAADAPDLPGDGAGAPAVSANIDAALAFLHAQYDPSTRLLRESPIVAPDRRWLATDNQLARLALAAAADPLAAEIAESLVQYGERFGAARHGVIEALTGVPVAWPPRTHTHQELLPGIWHEERITGAPMLDWAGYADLALYGALEAWNRGDAATARSRYAVALAHFDGVGFDDAAATTHYTTYKLALALLVGQQLQEPARPDLLAALLAKQDETGGFVTLYNRQGAPEGDANTETTSYALLALLAQAGR